MVDSTTFLSLTILAVSLGSQVSASQVGPVADLRIFNAEISPDGFPRQAVLAEGIFPGPVITAKKACLLLCSSGRTVSDCSRRVTTFAST